MQARSVFTCKLDESTSVLNMQMPGQNQSLSQASTLVQTLNKSTLLNTNKGIPFEEQVAIIKKLEQ